VPITPRAVLTKEAIVFLLFIVNPERTESIRFYYRGLDTIKPLQLFPFLYDGVLTFPIELL
jgi:hypothetical protein